jgi:hypothetical protein
LTREDTAHSKVDVLGDLISQHSEEDRLPVAAQRTAVLSGHLKRGWHGRYVMALSICAVNALPVTESQEGDEEFSQGRSQKERSSRQPANLHTPISMPTEMATHWMMRDKMERGGDEGLGCDHQVSEECKSLLHIL